MVGRQHDQILGVQGLGSFGQGLRLVEGFGGGDDRFRPCSANGGRVRIRIRLNKSFGSEQHASVSLRLLSDMPRCRGNWYGKSH